jgi:starch synthase (maltosyl-transferring)
MFPEQARSRVVIEGVKPEIDCGRFPVKRTVGEKVVVECDAFTDGHDQIACVLLWRREGEEKWTELPLSPLVNDRWRGEFTVTELGRYQYALLAWVDHFASWRRDLRKRVEADQDVPSNLLVGAALLEDAARRAPRGHAERLQGWARTLRGQGDQGDKVKLALDDDVARLVERYPDRRLATRYGKELAVVVDRERARFSTWYELFPRSAATEPGQHGTFRDVEARLSYVAELGFDVLYLPPIHPVGRTHRKGKNNNPAAEPGDVGSPWGIGASEGGHKALHPQLGTLEDFRRLLAKAKDWGIEIAMDVAYQCSPDHPYVKEHPEWFRKRPDGTIQYAENPPKKYQDIYPIDFETEQWQALWEELRSVVLYWIAQGVRIFRVDNPHTKPFPFWEWLITTVKEKHPDVIFLSEAFTRPKVMYRLAKLGFTQSYTYFAWRNTAWELQQYFTELTQTDVREFFRPNLWPNTPDILTDHLQHGGRGAFMGRLVLAATLGASYGIYGPAFELLEHVAIAPGKEEYLNSEKYEVRHWDLDRADSLREFIARVNDIRKKNPALHYDHNLRFHPVDNGSLLCYSKQSDDRSNAIVVVVNVDPYHKQSGFVELPLESFGVDPSQPFQVHDLLGDAYYLWQGPRNFVDLNPYVVPAHIFRIRHRIRTERDFEYYL